MGSAVSSLVKRAIAEQVFDDLGAGESYLDALKAFRSGRVTESKGGTVIIMTSGNGHEARYSVDQGFTQTDALELAQELVDAFREAYAKLGGTPTDQEVLDEMLVHLQAPSGIYSRFTDMRLGPDEEEPA